MSSENGSDKHIIYNSIGYYVYTGKLSKKAQDILSLLEVGQKRRANNSCVSNVAGWLVFSDVYNKL